MSAHGLGETLRPIEEKLQSRARSATVLEEVGFGWNDWNFLCTQLQPLFQKDPDEALHILRRYYRHTLAVFLSMTGTYRYNSDGVEGYWPHVEAALGVRQVPQSELGQHFERMILASGLTNFPRLTGRRYVSLILLHGGIPNHCLSNYFEHVLEPLARSDAGRYHSGRALLDEVLASPQARYLLQPVKDYLHYGGDVAADFVERTLDLHRRVVLDSTPTETADERRAIARLTGLPHRVVLQYNTWREGEGSREAAVLVAHHQLHWQAPVLVFDPSAGVPVINLPAQGLPAGEENGRWIVRCDDQSDSILAEGWRHGSTVRTRGGTYEAPKPCTSYRVTWQCGRAEASWKLAGLDEQVPLMAFYASDNKAIDVREGVPRTTVWVVRPHVEDHRGLDFAPHGAGRLEQFSPARGGWEGYISERWDLSGCPLDAHEVLVQRFPERKLWLLPRGDVRVHLSGVPLHGVTCADAPVYDHSPSLVIPLARTEEMLDQWTVRWRTSTAEGVLDLRDLAQSHRGRWSVPLSDLPVYMPVQLMVRGPLGRSVKLSLSVWPGLSIGGLDRMYVPDLEGHPQAVDLRVTSPDDVMPVGPRRSEDERVYAVRVPPEETATLLAFQRQGKRLPAITVEVSRLRWQLYDAASEGPSSVQATSHAVRLQGAWVERVTLPRVAVYGAVEELNTLRLYAEVNGRRIDCPRLGKGTTAFDVGVLTQMLREAGVGRARLRGEIGGRDFAIGSWHAQLGLDHLRAECQRTPGAHVVEATWTQGRWVEGAVVRLWPLWVPWEEMREAEACADGPQACHAVFDELLPGEYLAELTVSDPWSSGSPQRPDEGGGDTVRVVVGTVLERYQFCVSLPGVRGRLARYLAATDAAQRSAAWSDVCVDLSPSDLPDVLRVLTQLKGDAYEHSLAKALAERAFDRLCHQFEGEEEGLFSAVASYPKADQQPALALMLGLLDGPAPWTPEQGLRVWAPLGACALQPPLSGVDTADLGWEPETTPTLEAFLEQRVFGGPVEEAQIRVTPAALDAQRAIIGLVPGGPLGEWGGAVGYFDWHRRRLEHGALSDDLTTRTLLHDVEAHLTALSKASPYAQPLVEAVYGRLNYRAREGDAPRWLNVPFVVGALALVLRAHAQDEAFRKYLSPSRRGTHSCALTALLTAPQLFTHDLCWFSTAFALLSNADAPTA